MLRLIGNRGRHILAWFIAGTIILVSGWVGDGVEGNKLFFAKEVDYLPVKWCIITGLILFWILLAIILDWLVLYLLPLRTLSQKRQADPHKVLITPISVADESAILKTIEQRGEDYWLVEKDNNGNITREQNFANGLDDIFTCFESSRHSVVPLLRSLKCHRKNEILREVHFLASTKSVAFANKLKDALDTCVKGISIKIYRPALDFEDVDEVYHALDQLVGQIIDSGYKEKDIIVDLTGGQKPTSVALALYTLHRDIVCQYVQTGGDKAVIQYDMALHPPIGVS